MRYLFLLFVVLLLPATVQAETILVDGSAITVAADETIEGDYYVSVGALDTTTMSGTIMGDMYAVGGTVTANGDITEDLGIIGLSAQMHASVTDDVRVVAGETVVANTIGGDLIVIGGVLKVLSTADITGDIFFYGGSAIIAGSVGGSIYGTYQELMIDGTVGTNVDVKAQTAVGLGDSAAVAGSVAVVSPVDIARAPGATVEGDVRVTSSITDPSEMTRATIIPILISLFATLSIYLLFRTELIVLTQIVHESYPRAGLIGLAALILAPVITVILLVSVLGFFLGVMSLGLTILLYVAGMVVSGVIMGAGLARMFTSRSAVTLSWILLGTLVLHGVSFIPMIGPIVVLAVMIVTTGGICIGGYRLLR